MDNMLTFSIALGIVVGIGFYFKTKKTIEDKKTAEKMAKKHAPQLLRNPNIRRVK